MSGTVLARTIPAARARRRKLAITPWMFLAPSLLVLVGLVAYPFLDGIWTSMTDRGIGTAGVFVGLRNFAALYGNPVYYIAIRNSVMITLGAVAVKTVIGMLAALMLAERIPLRGLIRALVFLPWAVPALIAALTWRWIFDELNGVLNEVLIASGITGGITYFLSDPSISLYSITAAIVWQGLPFFVMMFLAGLASIPAELYEAAAIDGAGPISRFRNVTLPSMRDVISITVMLSAIWTFNAFTMVFILTNGGPANRTQILPTLAYDFSIRQSQLGMGAAVIVSFVPVLGVLIVLLTRGMLRERAAE
jgi:multiple sugar transport system permease protein